MVGLVVRFILRRGEETRFDELVDPALRLIAAQDPGTVLYLVHEVRDAPHERLFYELYRDDEAFVAHDRSGYVRAFLAEVEELLAAPVEVARVRLHAGVGIDLERP